MIATIAAMTVLVGQQNVNAELVTPVRSHDKIKAMAQQLGHGLYAPDRTPRGYSLRSVDYVALPNTDPKRHVVRLKYINPDSANVLTILQAPAKGKEASGQMDAILNSSLFDVSKSKYDTWVTMRRGDMDLGLLGALIADTSAKQVIERMVYIRP
ncbi:MAG: hypothetical protein KDC26_01510 [Armatimonadetes bacterium]|nr:hypothetical protein [Armatimonadota bacterium]